MIVPFVFNLYEYTKENVMFLGVFYKFFDFCLKNNMPIIGQEEFFLNPDYYKKINHSATQENLFNYSVPTKDDFDKVTSYIISKEQTNSLKDKTLDDYENYKNLISSSNKTFEKIIELAINKIEEERNEKIKAILTWVSFPSLRYICKKRNIELINYEFSSIRYGHFYNDTLGCFSFENKYSSKQFINYYNFLKNEQLNLLSREELLCLFLNKSSLRLLKEYKNNSKYEFGIALGLKKDFFDEVYYSNSVKSIIEQMEKLVKLDDISVREHPAYPYEFKNPKFVIDDSNSSIDWILKCKRIVSTTSNVGYEAMLFGKTSIILSKNMPFHYNTVNTLDVLDDFVVDLKYLNIITFGFFTPFDWMFDINYIDGRLGKPTPIEIYNYNINYILKKHKIENLFKIPAVKRKEKILSKVHKLGDNVISEFSNYKYSSELDIYKLNLNNLQKEIEKLNKEISEKNNQLNTIVNSKGWILLEKLRKLKNRILK